MAARRGVLIKLVHHACQYLFTPSLSQIPLVVKDGALVPMIGDRQFAPGAEEALPLEVRHYGDQPGTLRLYDDDGETFDYELGERTWTRVEAAKDASGAWKGTVTLDSNGKRWRYSGVTWRFMTR
jgi:alpha-D-xyloside xylohydrolase